MKKTVLMFLILIALWGWSFYGPRWSDNVSGKDSFEQKTKSKKDIKLTEILKYDPNVEVDICPTDRNEFAKSLVSLTFDDGWKEIYQYAVPILNQAGMKSTHYVNVRGPSNSPNKLQTRDDILAIQEAGHEIGSHGFNHFRFTELDNQKIGYELEESKRALLNMGIKSIDTFAYPYGEYTDFSRLQSQKYYTAVRTAIPGMNDRKTDKYLLYGYELRNWMVFDPYLKRLVDRARAENKWLIIIFHQVAKPDYPYYTSPEDLHSLINYLIQNKIPVMTVRDVIRKCY